MLLSVYLVELTMHANHSTTHPVGYADESTCHAWLVLQVSIVPA